LIVPSAFETRLLHDLNVPVARDHLERVELQLPVLVDRNRLERRTRALRDVLPGNEVGVMLELGDDDDVPRAEVVEAPRVGDEIDALRAPCVNTTSRVAGALMNCATFSRAPSYSAVATSDSV